MSLYFYFTEEVTSYVDAEKKNQKILWLRWKLMMQIIQVALHGRLN